VSLPYRWHPTGTRWKTRPDVGDLLPIEHAVWRVIDVHDLPEHQQEERRQSFVVVLRQVGAGDDVRDRDMDRHLQGPDWHFWDVYPDAHYPVCASCQEPLPCREQTAARVSAESAKWMTRYETPGVCPACQEPVTRRQESLTWSDNLEVLGGPPVTYHVGRRGCRLSAARYEERWVQADPERRRATLSCSGHVTNHGDGTYSCTQLAECPGPRAGHRGHSTCSCCGQLTGGKHGCFPRPDAQRRDA
jgi:hypothetical protein